VIQLAVRWMLDQGIGVALWGARRPEQLNDSAGVGGWALGATSRAQIDRILDSTISDPVGPEFMAPPARA
jgi:aryl-alcohol dehydrogenase-like predicted oxidoreductase